MSGFIPTPSSSEQVPENEAIDVRADCDRLVRHCNVTHLDLLTDSAQEHMVDGSRKEALPSHERGTMEHA